MHTLSIRKEKELLGLIYKVTEISIKVVILLGGEMRFGNLINFK